MKTSRQGFIDKCAQPLKEQLEWFINNSFEEFVDWLTEHEANLTVKSNLKNLDQLLRDRSAYFLAELAQSYNYEQLFYQWYSNYNCSNPDSIFYENFDFSKELSRFSLSFQYWLEKSVKKDNYMPKISLKSTKTVVNLIFQKTSFGFSDNFMNWFLIYDRLIQPIPAYESAQNAFNNSCPKIEPYVGTVGSQLSNVDVKSVWTQLLPPKYVGDIDFGVEMPIVEITKKPLTPTSSNEVKISELPEIKHSKEEWEPKIGDRVIVIQENHFYFGIKGVITRSAYNYFYIDQGDGCELSFFKEQLRLDIEKIVSDNLETSKKTTNIVETEKPKKTWRDLKIGDKIKTTDIRYKPDKEYAVTQIKDYIYQGNMPVMIENTWLLQNDIIILENETTLKTELKTWGDFKVGDTVRLKYREGCTYILNRDYEIDQVEKSDYIGNQPLHIKDLSWVPIEHIVFPQEWADPTTEDFPNLHKSSKQLTPEQLAIRDLYLLTPEECFPVEDIKDRINVLNPKELKIELQKPVMLKNNNEKSSIIVFDEIKPIF